MKVRAYAKVNLALDVVRKREDGYHDLEMIMAPITLHDLIYINIIDEGIEILLGTEAGVKDENGEYPPESVHGRVMAKLREFNDLNDEE